MHSAAALSHPRGMVYEAFTRNGLILRDAIRPYVTERSLRRDLAAGTLLRLRRGVFVEAAQWAELPPRGQHIYKMRAVAALAKGRVVFCSESAAAAWKMPIEGDWPDDVAVLEQWRGGGQSEPGVRRTSVGASTARTVTIHGLEVTDLARTTLDVTRARSFVDAIGSVDWALWRKNTNAVTADDLATDLRRLGPRAGGVHLQRLIEFATPLSDSFYESAARAVIHQLGFAAPELQVRLADSRGEMIPDFFWRSVNVLGEFDGKEKYMRDEYTDGDPGEVVWREKKREDRLRALKFTVVRILTEHVTHPATLERLLVAAGVPRR
jgi:hypothetical protein